MRPRLAAVLFWIFLAAARLLAQADLGDPREKVLRLHGKPTSIARRGDHEILVYPKGARVELVEGKVVDIRGVLPAAPADAAPETAAPATEQAPTPAPAATPAANDAPAAPPAANASPASAPTPKNTPPAAGESPADRLAREIEKMEKAKPGDDFGSEHDAAGGAFNLVALLVSLVLHFGITVLALRLAFKYWEMDAFWTGTLAIAGIDLAVFGVLELLGPVTSGISTSGAVQGGIGTLVMVFTVQRFCFNKRLQNAVLTALAVKVIVQLCHIFLFVIVLNALFT